MNLLLKSNIKHMSYDELDDAKLSIISKILSNYKKKKISKNAILCDITDVIYEEINCLMVLKRALNNYHIKLFETDKKPLPIKPIEPIATNDPKITATVSIEPILSKEPDYNMIKENTLNNTDLITPKELITPAMLEKFKVSDCNLLNDLNVIYPNFNLFKHAKNNNRFDDQGTFQRYITQRNPEILYKYLNTSSKLVLNKIYNEINE